jgi:Tol biopolymer transport system component
MMNRKSVIFISFLFCCLFACNLFEGSSSDADESATDTGITFTETSIIVEETEIPDSSPSEVPPTEPLPPSRVLSIVYTHEGNIWLIEADNPPQQLTSSGYAEEVVISSDGVKIAYTRRLSFDDLAELRVVNSDGSGETTLLSIDDMKTLYPSTLESKGFEISQMAFLYGTHDLIFNTYEAFKEIGVAMTNDLLRLDTETGNLTRLLPPTRGGNFKISPDSTRIVVVQPEKIHLVNPDGTGLQTNLITYDQVITYSEFLYYAQPVWSRDSSAVGFAIPSKDPLGGNPYGDIWRLPSDGSSANKAGTIYGDFYFSQVFTAPSLSPRLNRVAFIRESGTRDLFLANADGSGEAVYDSGEIEWYGWAPDGIHFVYSIGDPMNLILGKDGGASIPLATGIDLRWINESEYLYLEGSLGSWSLMKGRIGSTPRTLASPSGDFISYNFSK